MQPEYEIKEEEKQVPNPQQTISTETTPLLGRNRNTKNETEAEDINIKKEVQLHVLHKLLTERRLNGPNPGEHSAWQNLTFGALFGPFVAVAVLTGITYLLLGEEDTGKVPGIPGLEAPESLDVWSAFLTNATVNFFFMGLSFAEFLLSFPSIKRLKEEISMPTHMKKKSGLFLFTLSLAGLGAYPISALGFKHYPKFEDKYFSFLVNMIVNLTLNGQGANVLSNTIISPVFDFFIDWYKLGSINKAASKFLRRIKNFFEETRYFSGIFKEIAYCFGGKLENYTGTRPVNIDTFENRVNYLKENPHLLFKEFNSRNIPLETLTKKQLEQCVMAASKTKFEKLEQQKNTFVWGDSFLRDTIKYAFILFGAILMLVSLYGYAFLTRDADRDYLHITHFEWEATGGVSLTFLILSMIITKNTMSYLYDSVIEKPIKWLYHKIRNDKEDPQEPTIQQKAWYYSINILRYLIVAVFYYLGFQSSIGSLNLNTDANPALTSAWANWFTALGTAIFNGSGAKGITDYLEEKSESKTVYSRHYDPNNSSLEDSTKFERVEESFIRNKLNFFSDFVTIDPHTTEQDYQEAYNNKLHVS